MSGPRAGVRRGPVALALAVLAILALGAVGCRSQPAASAPPADDVPEHPYVVVLGTAQDGGLPQIGCREPCCERARREPERRRLVTSLLLVDPRSGARWLFDASPDLKEQVERARSHAAPAPGAGKDGARPPLFDGVFLTHAHLGHYTGLLQLGNEAYGARALPVHASPRLAAFFHGNDPWRWMVARGDLVMRELAPGDSVRLAPDLTVTAFPVRHRDEFSDTVAFEIRGPRRALLYLPDVDKWERDLTPIEERLARVDVALLDGTFFAEGEVPGRAMADIPHPFIEESLARLGALPEQERAKVLFTHLNHSNPAADPESEAAHRVRSAGMDVAQEQRILEL